MSDENVDKDKQLTCQDVRAHKYHTTLETGVGVIMEPSLSSINVHKPYRVYVFTFVLYESVLMQVQDLTGQVTKSPGVYIAYGGFSDIYKGIWRNIDTGQSTVVSHWWLSILLLPNMILDCHQTITYCIHR
jgi:hypothetical protein